MPGNTQIPAGITISDHDPWVAYVVASTPATTFAFNFEYFQDEDIEVYTLTDGEDQWVKRLDYSITPITGYPSTGYGSGQIEFNAEVQDLQVVITKPGVFDRLVNYTLNQPMDWRALNRDLNRIIALEQILRMRSKQSLRVGLQEDPGNAGTELPDVQSRANQVLGFDSSGRVLMYPESGIGPVGPAGSAGFGIVVQSLTELRAIEGPIADEIALLGQQNNGQIYVFDATNNGVDDGRNTIVPNDGTNGAWEALKLNNLLTYTGSWNSGHVIMGPWHIWIDTVGDLRIKNGAPVADTDGRAIGGTGAGYTSYYTVNPNNIWRKSSGGTYSPASTQTTFSFFIFQGAVQISNVQVQVTRTGDALTYAVTAQTGEPTTLNVQGVGGSTLSMTVEHDTSGHTIGAAALVIADGEPGTPGQDGADAAQYVINTPDGTAIKNGAGSVSVQLQLVQGSGITDINSGNVQLWTSPDGSGSIVGNGYTATLGPAEVNGSLTIYARDIGSSVVYDSTTIVDIYDGADGDPGTPGEDAVFGYVLNSNGLVWIRDKNNIWTPGSYNSLLTAYFVKAGVEIATRSVQVTLNPATGYFTASEAGSTGEATQWIAAGAGTQRLTITFEHVNSGVSVVEQTYSVRDGIDGQDGQDGDPGTPGAPGIDGLAVLPNYSLFTTPNPGECYFHGYDQDGNAADVAGFVRYGGQEIVVANGAVFAGAIGRGHIILETDPLGYTFAHGGSQDKIALCYRNEAGNWFYDQNGTWTAFTPTQTMLSIGLFVTESADNIKQATVNPPVPFDATTGELGWSDQVTETQIANDSITTPKIAAGAVLANNISVANLSAISASMGALTSGALTVGLNGYVRQGKTSYVDNEAGWFIGDTSGTPTVNIGDATNYLKWNGSTLEIAGQINIVGGSGYSNISDAPASLADLDPAQDGKLDGVQPGATNNGSTISTVGDIIGQVNISSQGIVLSGNTSFIKSSGKDSILDTARGVFIGKDASTGGYWDFAVGDGQKYIRWDGDQANLEIGGDVIITGNLVSDAVSIRRQINTGNANTGTAYTQVASTGGITGADWMMVTFRADALKLDGNNIIVGARIGVSDGGVTQYFTTADYTETGGVGSYPLPEGGRAWIDSLNPTRTYTVTLELKHNRAGIAPYSDPGENEFENVELSVLALKR